MAFTYGIFGRVSLRWVLIVVMVSTVVTPGYNSTNREIKSSPSETEVILTFTCSSVMEEVFRSFALVKVTILHLK